MKLYSLLVLHKPESGDPTVLKAAFDLTSFGYFQRSSIQEFIRFTSKILAERTPPAQRQSVKENEYMCHCYVRTDGLIGVCVSDEEYQTRVAHSLITKILDDFAGQVPRAEWTLGKEVPGFSGPLDVYLKKYQDPATVDPMTKMQNELDETKIILHSTIAAVFGARGEAGRPRVEERQPLAAVKDVLQDGQED